MFRKIRRRSADRVSLELEEATRGEARRNFAQRQSRGKTARKKKNFSLSQVLKTAERQKLQRKGKAKTFFPMGIIQLYINKIINYL